MRRLDDINLDQIAPRKIQMGCMVLIGLIEFFTMFFGILVDGPLKNYVVFYTGIVTFLFLGVTIRQPMNRTAKKLFWVGAGFCAWVLLLQLSDYRHFSPTAYYGARFIYSVFFCEYLMMLPWAALTDEGEKATGLKLLGVFYILASLAYCGLTIMLYFEKIPVIFERFMGWDGSRLGINFHPNDLARVFMLGGAFSLIFLSVCRKWWWRALMSLMLVGNYLGLTLTNARVAVVLFCCMLAGTVFFLIYTGGDVKKGTWQRFLLGMLAAVIVLLAAYKGSSKISELNHMLVGETVQISPTEVQLICGPRDLDEDLFTFNGRTTIWAGAFEGIRNHPEVLLLGTREPGKLISQYATEGFAHAHNAWIETLLRLGLVGLGFALYLTWLALKNTVLLMFFRKTSLMQKLVTMLVLCVMGTQLMEPYLFYVECPFCFGSIPFMLCLGYLVYWEGRTEKIRPFGPSGKSA